MASYARIRLRAATTTGRRTILGVSSAGISHGFVSTKKNSPTSEPISRMVSSSVIILLKERVDLFKVALGIGG